jgi:hypothetical protein
MGCTSITRLQRGCAATQVRVCRSWDGVDEQKIEKLLKGVPVKLSDKTKISHQISCLCLCA